MAALNDEVSQKLNPINLFYRTEVYDDKMKAASAFISDDLKQIPPILIGRHIYNTAFFLRLPPVMLSTELIIKSSNLASCVDPLDMFLSCKRFLVILSNIERQVLFVGHPFNVIDFNVIDLYFRPDVILTKLFSSYWRT